MTVAVAFTIVLSMALSSAPVSARPAAPEALHQLASPLAAGTANPVLRTVGASESAPGSFSALSPARVLDTRTSTGAPGPVPGNGTIELQITGRGGVPITGVAAVALNITAVSPTSGGYLTVWPATTSQPNASNLNFSSGQTVPNFVVVPVGANGKIKLFNGSPGTIQLLADVAGYYLAGTPATPGSFAALSPARVLDTRTSTGAPGPVPGNGTIELQITGRGGVPITGVAAVALNITAVSPTSGGYLTVWPATTSQPNASNLNFSSGQTVPNFVVVPVGANGKIKLFNGSPGTIQLLADVAGYYLSMPPFTWSGSQLIEPTRSGASDVSCVSSTFCMAVDTYGNFFTFNGTAWSTPARITSGSDSLALTGVSCASASMCIAVGFDVAYKFDGASWASQTVPSPRIQSAAVSCPSTTFCLAVDYAGLSWKYDGTNWATVSGAASSRSFSCVSATQCISVGPSGANRFDGTGWGGSTTIPVQGQAVSCSSANSCVAVGRDPMSPGIKWTAFDGTAWSTAASIVDGLSDPYRFDLSCTSASFCMALAPVTGPPSNGVSSSTPQALRFNGSSWSTSSTGAGLTKADVMSCASTTCVAVGQYSYLFSAGTWSTGTPANTPNFVTDLQCVGPTWCMAVDYSGRAVRYDGTAWSSPVSVNPTAHLTSLSCPSRSFCVAGDDDGQVFLYQGAGWSDPQSTHMSSVDLVSCPTTTFCVASSSDDGGATSLMNGSNWTATPGPGPIWDLSCVSGAFCGAVLSGGDAAFLQAGSWTVTSPEVPLMSIACATTTFCVGGGFYGLDAIEMYDGSNWIGTGEVGLKGIFNLECPTTAFCAGTVGTAEGWYEGLVTTLDGTWSEPVVAPGQLFTSMSCPTTTFCVVVDQQNRTYTGTR